MSGIPQTKMLARVGRGRKQVAFLSVAAATFFCLSLFWPLSTKQWRSESDVSVKLTQRQNSGKEFKALLEEVVARHTSAESISATLRDNGMGVEVEGVTTGQIAEKVIERLNVRMIKSPFDPNQVSIRVGLTGAATEKENYFVNLLATTIARDFMTSPLAGIIPVDPVPSSTIEALQQRHAEIESRANEILSQIATNLNDAAEQLAVAETEEPELVAPFASRQRDTVNMELQDLANQRDRIASSSGDSSLELSAIDQQIMEKQSEYDELVELASKRKSDSPFRMASHTLSRSGSKGSLKAEIDSLQSTIADLANVAAEACTVAESASRTQPAFEIYGVQSRAVVPVGAVPGGKEFMFLMLASCVFATIVSLAYQPFYETGFESVSDIEKKLKLPVVATLETRNEFEDVTGPGIPAESAKDDSAGANQVVNICKWILFGSLMLTIGFCLVNADIRNAFLDGPFHGYARIVWALKGN